MRGVCSTGSPWSFAFFFCPRPRSRARDHNAPRLLSLGGAEGGGRLGRKRSAQRMPGLGLAGRRGGAGRGEESGRGWTLAGVERGGRAAALWGLGVDFEGPSGASFDGRSSGPLKREKYPSLSQPHATSSIFLSGGSAQSRRRATPASATNSLRLARGSGVELAGKECRGSHAPWLSAPECFFHLTLCCLNPRPLRPWVYFYFFKLLAKRYPTSNEKLNF